MKKYKTTFTGKGDIYPLNKFITEKTVIAGGEVFMIDTPHYKGETISYTTHIFNIHQLEKEGIVTIEEIAE